MTANHLKTFPFYLGITLLHFYKQSDKDKSVDESKDEVSDASFNDSYSTGIGGAVKSRRQNLEKSKKEREEQALAEKQR